jgi:hypothetical protein
MNANSKKANHLPIVPLLLLAVGTIASAPSSQAADDAQGPPRIIRTSPDVGATEVDPAVTEITVTFDRDMGGGMSWTGGGSEFPKSPESQQAHWLNKRTCVLPVKLYASQYYRVGINAPSFHGFQSTEGVPVSPSAIYFTTTGASEMLKRKMQVPRVVHLEPLNGAKDVSPAVKELRVTFNVPMAKSFSWTGGGPEFPGGPEGKRPYWTEDKKTCVLPVELKPGSNYRVGLNSLSFKGFQSAGGVALDPVVYTFSTTSN